MATEQLTLVWTSVIVTDGDGTVRIVARKPLSHMSRARAAKVIGCSEWTVSDLFRFGYLKGYKPGARKQRSDGRASNAALIRQNPFYRRPAAGTLYCDASRFVEFGGGTLLSLSCHFPA